ncbi:MAG: uroporphyrinogen-III C-methyltransferase [Chloroflexi bacterium]|nr:uroporphyrinogen-III C-methyltransferase [Chloroflexota bacterium]
MGQGKVYLIGAGPGDPGLITVKGLRSIQSADVIVYDRLVDKRLLGHARPDAALIDVGKIPGEGGSTQANINALLVSEARKGLRVARLKGGDPFVFGRGGEEAEVLHSEGIPFEVVPGVTSAIAAPAYAGIPLTHRKLASSFTVVTGSESPGKDASALDWELLAKQEGTLVVLMGWESLASIVEALVRYGKPADTPVALVRWGTRPDQKTVTGTLADIVDTAKEAGLTSPIVTVIGEVVSLRETLRWFDNRPLFGKRVLITRTRAQAGVLSELLFERGAQSIELPTIEIQPLDDYGRLDNALRSLNSYDWVIFTSVNAVQVVFARLEALGLDSRAYHACKIAAIGPATASALREHGLVANFVPDTFVSEAIIDGLRGQGFNGGRVLLPRAESAREALNEGLCGLGATVDEIPVYRTVTPEDSASLVDGILSEGIDIATFTSSSTVTNLMQLLDGDVGRLSGATIACIGPITAATAREMGLKVDIVSSEHTIAGLIEALETYFKEESQTHE